MPEEKEVKQETTNIDDIMELEDEELDKKLDELQKEDKKINESTVNKKEDKDLEDPNKGEDHTSKDDEEGNHDKIEKKEPTIEERLKALEDENKSLLGKDEETTKKLKDKELFIQRQGNELGDLRKKVYTPPTPEEQVKLAEHMVTNPYDTVKEINTRIENENKLEKVPENDSEQDRKIKEHAVKTKMDIIKVYPKAEEYVDDIGKLFAEDGFPPELVTKFKEQPWNESPLLLMGMIRRVEVNKKMSSMNLELEKLKTSKEDVIKNIEETANEKKHLKQGDGEENNKRNYDKNNIGSWSDKELDEYLNKNE